MIDNIDPGKIPEEVFASPTETPFSFDGVYSPEEAKLLIDFMHSDFPHFTYGGIRDKGVVIEIPPEEICSASKWKEILDVVFVPEWENIHIRLKRNCRFIIRFVDRIHDYKHDADAIGSSITLDGEQLIRINYRTKDGNVIPDAYAIFTLIHELTETDFWAKTLYGDPDTNVDESEFINAAKGDPIRYRQYLDEKIANRRALRAIRRFDPTVTPLYQEDIYDEDR